MINILLEEEREERKKQNSEVLNFQPCLEFFMQNKIMETLCQLGEKDVY